MTEKYKGLDHEDQRDAIVLREDEWKYFMQWFVYVVLEEGFRDFGTKTNLVFEKRELSLVEFQEKFRQKGKEKASEYLKKGTLKKPENWSDDKAEDFIKLGPFIFYGKLRWAYTCQEVIVYTLRTSKNSLKRLRNSSVKMKRRKY